MVDFVWICIPILERPGLNDARFIFLCTGMALGYNMTIYDWRIKRGLSADSCQCDTHERLSTPETRSSDTLSRRVTLMSA